MSVVTYGELHFGASKSSQSDRAMLTLEELIQDIPVEPLDYAAGQAYGEIRAPLEKKGRPIGDHRSLDRRSRHGFPGHPRHQQ